MTDYTSQSRSDTHDSYDGNGGYQRRCYCQKCKKTYGEWCKRKRQDGCTNCKRKCYTVCEIVCEKDVTKVTRWGYNKRYEGKWESVKGEHAPKPCKDCKREGKECRCNKKHGDSSGDYGRGSSDSYSKERGAFYADNGHGKGHGGHHGHHH